MLTKIKINSHLSFHRLRFLIVLCGKLRFSIFAVLLLLLQTPVLNAQDPIPRFRFENAFLGMGINSTQYTIKYPETEQVYSNETKQSLLIDVRLFFETQYGLLFSPIFNIWSWTDNSGQQKDKPQTGINDFAFMFDLIKMVEVREGVHFFAGGGFGVHFLTYWTKFPLSTPYFDYNTGFQLNQITVKTVNYAPDALGGFRYKLSHDITLVGETRYEFTNDIKQWKYLLGITLF